MFNLTGLYADNKPLFYAAAMLAIVIVVLLAFFVWRMLFGRGVRVPGAARSRQVRLGVVDVHDIDRERQLVLVRRDNVEHLIMIGGPNDLLIEAQIVRVEARPPRDAGQPGIPAPASAIAKAPVVAAEAAKPPAVAAPPARPAPLPKQQAPAVQVLPLPAKAAAPVSSGANSPVPTATAKVQAVPTPAQPSLPPERADNDKASDAITAALAAALTPPNLPAPPSKPEIAARPAPVAPVVATLPQPPAVATAAAPPAPRAAAVPVPRPVAVLAVPLPPVAVASAAPVPAAVAREVARPAARPVADAPPPAVPGPGLERFPSMNLVRPSPRQLVGAIAPVAAVRTPETPPPLAAKAEPVAEPVQPPVAAPAEPANNVVFDSLEEEMAKLLGRPIAGPR